MKRIGFGGQFLRINTIQESLIFSKQTIFKIFNKLVLSIDDICEVLNNAKNDNIIELSNWTLLLLEMDLFLKNNSRVLSKESNFSQTVEKVKSSYHQLSDVDSIFTAIISDDARKVREGIQNLVYRVESSGVKNLRTEYIVIANRIIIKQNAALQSCLVHFASVLKTNHPDFDNEIFMPLIDKMLVVYSPYFSNNKAIWNIDAKKEDVEDAMIEINKVAKKYRRGHIFWNNHKRIFKN